MMANTDDNKEETLREEEPYGLGCALEYFSEHEEIFKMIDNLKNIVEADNRSRKEKAYEHFSFILSQYIEQPHLLDSHLGLILEKFICIIRDTKSDIRLKHITFDYMFVVVNVRGYKVIVRHLPHEVTDFEPVLQLLESQDPGDPETWTTRYILLLWLSIIVMIPFHLSRFDAHEENTAGNKTVMDRILSLIKTYAVVPDKCRDAAAYLSYKFVTRGDVKERHLKSFFDWIVHSSLTDNNIFVKYGTMACAATILKHGKREDNLIHARRLLEWIINAEFKNNSGTKVQKLTYKIIQRIGLTFLPPRIATWRYQRGNRSLAANLSAGDSSGTQVVESTNQKENTSLLEEEIDVPDEVEEVIDQLINGLRSCDSIVRWSAAKGVGRVTCRLPKHLADEVVGSVVELLSPRENDAAWHGSCIALAELGRRGLLLPERLPQVVPLIVKALVYDEPRGYASVGSHIRDAACYVCWSFARAYDSNVLNPYVKEIASTMLVVTCFDKEINCRRAASAAFQENVGRQGTFPHGIDILTTADFFAVSVRNNAYLNISAYIAQFEEYTIPLIDHLVSRKVAYWDIGIRELTAKALHNLTAKAPKYMGNTVLPTLFANTKSIDLNCRHGTLLALGEIMYALSKLSKEQNVSIFHYLSSDDLENVKKLINLFQERLYFRGLGGELMKQAFSDFIEKCSLASLPIHADPVLDNWLELLNDCLQYEVSNVRLAAVNALPVFLNEYYSDPDKQTLNNDLIKRYVAELSSTTFQVTRMGHALALGSLPAFILTPNLHFIISALIKSSKLLPESQKWAESRRDAVKALTSISVLMIKEFSEDFSKNYVLEIYDTFLDGLKDYTQDKRGDIGAWMREACVSGLQVLTLNLTEYYPGILSSELLNRVLPGVAQQAMEKIDRTRALAGRVFYSFLYNNPKVPNIEYYDEICSIFPKEKCDRVNWNSPASTFLRFVQLLQFPTYTYNVLVGLITSIGGLTESLVKHSSSSFFSYLQCIRESKGLQEINRLCDTIYIIFLDYQKVDRITVPMFRCLDKLIDSGCINAIMEDSSSDYMKRLLKLVQMEIAGCKDIYKLIDGINLLCQFIQVKGEVCETAFVQLSILLCHKQSYIRRSTSTKLYESLLVYGDNSDISPEKLEEIMNVLSTTNWEDPVEQIKPTRNQICGLLGIRVPVVKKKT